MDWNGNSLSKLTELSKELTYHNPIEEGIKKVVSELNTTVEKELQDFCKYKEITLEDFLKNARCDAINLDSRYFYNGELILSIVTRDENLMEVKVDNFNAGLEARMYIIPHWKYESDVLHN